MNLSAKYQFRLPGMLWRTWKALIPERLRSVALRVFMEKAADAIRRNPMNMPRIVAGEYALVFPNQKIPPEFTHDR